MDLADELPKREHVREPPVPVEVFHPPVSFLAAQAELPSWWPGHLHGWRTRPDGAYSGLVTYRREYAPGFSRDEVSWVLSASVRPL